MSKPTSLATLISLATAALITNAPLADTDALSFEKLDGDNDGVISRSEGESVPELENLWSQIDDDASGAIDRAEFSAFEEQMRQGNAPSGGNKPQVHAPPFERLDQDNNGHITAVEGRELPLLHRNWSQFDTDDSGAIDRAEFSAFEEQMRQEKGASGDMNQEIHEKAKELMEQRQPR